MLQVGDKVEILNQDWCDTYESILGRIATIYEIERINGVLHYWIGFNTRNNGLRAFEAWQLKKI